MASSVVRTTLASFVVLALCAGFARAGTELVGIETNVTLEGHRVKEYSVLNGDPISVRCCSKSRTAYWINKQKKFFQMGAELNIAKTNMNTTGYYYCYDHLVNLVEVISIEVERGGRYNVTEGRNFNLTCGTKSLFAFWTNKHKYYKRGKCMSLFPAQRKDTGWYYCYRIHGDLYERIFLDVQYPAKILKVKRNNDPLNVNDTFSMTVTVEGHPDPMTSFVEEDGGKVISKKNGVGKFTIQTDPVICADGGMYSLTSQNAIGMDSKDEQLIVYCAPVPKAGIDKTVKPRLGEKVALKVENIGYPYPTYTWSFKGEVVENGTGDNKNEFDIDTVQIEDFGKYKLTMENKFGESTLKYTVQADGPPEPVKGLLISNVTENSAVVSFMSGYDYGDYQSFIVETYNGVTYEETAVFPDKAKKHNPHAVSLELKGLDIGTTYNLSIVANNSRGKGAMSKAFVVFTTEAPYTNYEIVEGEDLHLDCNTTGMKKVHWELADGTVVSSTDELNVENITRAQTGDYKCVGTGARNLLHVLEDYHVDVDYPAQILNISIEDNFFTVNETLVMTVEVEGHPTPTITFTKVRHGEVVFQDKAEGTLDITVDPIECWDLGMYELNVTNKLSSEIYEQPVFVYCPPIVDPKVEIKKTFYPRLGNKESLRIENYGYPYPTYKWKHGENPVDTHEDSDYESQVALDVTVEDFGSYFVDMENEYGLADFKFEVIASGPPDPITDFKLDNKTDTSVTLSWMSGYNYGKNQTFVVMATRNVPDNLLAATETKNYTIVDPSQHGMEKGSYVIADLVPGTAYNFTVVSFNGNGTSTMPKASVDTTTSDAPNPSAQTGDKSEQDAIIGGVVGAVCFVGIIVVVAIFLKKRHARRTNYQNIDG